MSTPVENEVEFRSYYDDAWYSVQLLRGGDGEKLTVRFFGFSADDDKVYEVTNFTSLEKLVNFQSRFRSVSKQLQDSECSKVVDGLEVCASHAFNDNDVRFYDAVVEHVLHKKHSFASGNEECLCSFVLHWKHGPNAGTLLEKKVENICLIRSDVELHPFVASFVKIAREKIEGASHKLVSASSGDFATYNNSASHKENGSQPTKRKPTYSQCLMRGKFAKRSAIKTLPCEGRTEDLSNKNRQDIDVGGVGNHYTILLENLEKELSPLTIIKFIHQETRITPQAYVFPSLQSELSTRGVIVLYSKKDVEDLIKFLNSPDHIIVSSRGRPWVVTGKFWRRDAFRASINSSMLNSLSQKKLQNTNAGISHELKVVQAGSEEYRNAKKLRDLFMEFSTHLERLYKKLGFMESKILQSSSSVDSVSGN